MHGDLYSDVDVKNTLAHYGHRWAATLEYASPKALAAMQPLVLETLERVAECVDQAAVDAGDDPTDVALLCRRLDQLGLLARSRLSGDTTAARHIIAFADEQLRRGGRLLAEMGETPTGTGQVVQINASHGGVPKTAVDSGTIGPSGLVGDTQRSRQHHGRPWQALCLFDQEIIDRWAREGHPIANGCVGENLTVSGLPWMELRPGVELAIGRNVVVHVTAYAVPCGHQRQWFSDGDFDRLSHDHNPGFARLYAEVLATGDVVPGDRVTIR